MGRNLIKPIELGALADALKLDAVGDRQSAINRVETADHAQRGGLAFAKSQRWVDSADPSCVLLTSPEFAQSRMGTYILSDRPRLDFALALAALENLSGFRWSTESAEVHASARVGKNVVLGRGVKIGQNCVIHHNVVIGDEVVIGDRCVIKSGAVIGEEGFGFERDTSGRAVRLPHLGSVVIEDDVEVGSLTTVCRGTLSNTLLKRGCKIDDHVHIAHNVIVGEDAFVIACAEVSGGVLIGPRAWVAPNASILNQLTIGEESVVGLGAVVVKSVPDREVFAGNPAKPLTRKAA